MKTLGLSTERSLDSQPFIVPGLAMLAALRRIEKNWSATSNQGGIIEAGVRVGSRMPRVEKRLGELARSVGSPLCLEVDQPGADARTTRVMTVAQRNRWATKLVA
jgi:hypothetical protein